jgi:hypothetical protein
MLLFAIFYAIFLIVLVAGGGMDWGDHGRYY